MDIELQVVKPSLEIFKGQGVQIKCTKAIRPCRTQKDTATGAKLQPPGTYTFAVRMRIAVTESGV